jgi:hypothetical protein
LQERDKPARGRESDSGGGAADFRAAGDWAKLDGQPGQVPRQAGRWNRPCIYTLSGFFFFWHYTHGLSLHVQQENKYGDMIWKKHHSKKWKNKLLCILYNTTFCKQNFNPLFFLSEMKRFVKKKKVRAMEDEFPIKANKKLHNQHQQCQLLHESIQKIQTLSNHVSDRRQVTSLVFFPSWFRVLYHII